MIVLEVGSQSYPSDDFRIALSINLSNDIEPGFERHNPQPSRCIIFQESDGALDFWVRGPCPRARSPSIVTVLITVRVSKMLTEQYRVG